MENNEKKLNESKETIELTKLSDDGIPFALRYDDLPDDMKDNLKKEFESKKVD